ncbi:MAG: MotA/TolQ/ExbB proton channel family protein [Holophagales bacterium]|jgi:biopolymer transport protein TolQ|nr:MotA/TolQ/ExbB proton channel family protein [Holophagales bacterium]MBK9967851.1 MotA/TolQ/ExbB proton channel family protein [Holophagales bacterium]
MTEAGNANIVQLFLTAGWTARAVLIILALFSLGSWAVIVGKLWSFSRAASHSGRFLAHFRKSRKFADVLGVCEQYPSSPLVGLFRAGYAELDAQVRAGRDVAPADNGRLFVKSLPAIERALERAAGVETNHLTKRLAFLATTASATPFIGLFGTVWGILGAFRQIGITGSTSIVTVAPGIAEALVNTAAGLVAAVPALIAYNYFNGQVRVTRSEMRDFALEFLNLAERHFT